MQDLNALRVFVEPAKKLGTNREREGLAHVETKLYDRLVCLATWACFLLLDFSSLSPSYSSIPS